MISLRKRDKEYLMTIDQLIEGNLTFQNSSFRLLKEEFDMLIEKGEGNN